MGNRKLKKLEVNSKLTWAEWLIDRKEALTIQEDRPRDSNFIPSDHRYQSFAGIPGPCSPGVLPRALPKSKKQQKKPQ